MRSASLKLAEQASRRFLDLCKGVDYDQASTEDKKRDRFHLKNIFPSKWLSSSRAHQIDEEDHNACLMEYLPYPEYRRAQLLALGYDPENLPDQSSLLGGLSLFTGKDGYLSKKAGCLPAQLSLTPQFT